MCSSLVGVALEEECAQMFPPRPTLLAKTSVLAVFLIFTLLYMYHRSSTLSKSTYLFTRPVTKAFKCSPINLSSYKVDIRLPKWSALFERYVPWEKGGHFLPEDCDSSEERIAVVIPYKNRTEHLQTLLLNLHSLLQLQKLDYVVFVIEPIGNTFNRAKLMNIGFAEAVWMYDFNCFIFHDVDLIPLNSRIPYTCRKSPAHLSCAIDKFHFVQPYPTYFGGVVAFSVEHFRLLNGASNRFWGWGGEDDELHLRVLLHNLTVSRPSNEVGRYKMLAHARDEGNRDNICRYRLLRQTPKLWSRDGLRNLLYQTVSMELLPLYTHIRVDLMEKRSRYRDGTLQCDE